ncbi:MAG: GIY-YIG nuclease family protein [Reichenbachiella sp.]|uniref:GIY-YIG nuclease family protein n=1 Tax=Reichenbachiella sp. TaxID=2184521 RepID=UPI0032671760
MEILVIAVIALFVLLYSNRKYKRKHKTNLFGDPARNKYINRDWNYTVFFNVSCFTYLAGLDSFTEAEDLFNRKKNKGSDFLKNPQNSVYIADENMLKKVLNQFPLEYWNVKDSNADGKTFFAKVGFDSDEDFKAVLTSFYWQALGQYLTPEQREEKAKHGTDYELFHDYLNKFGFEVTTFSANKLEDLRVNEVRRSTGRDIQFTNQEFVEQYNLQLAQLQKQHNLEQQKQLDSEEYKLQQIQKKLEEAEPLIVDEPGELLNNPFEGINLEVKTYLMLDEVNGYVKIGKSKNPKIREKTLQSEKPSIVMKAILNRDVEGELHKNYCDYRYRGEWFKLSKRQVEDIMVTYNFELL